MNPQLIQISKELVKEAYDYALKSRAYTSDRHDFHEGGLDAKQHKMFEGKLGEKIFKMILNENNISYQEDSSSYTEADIYDFIMPDNATIDVKTRTQAFHTRTLEMVEQYNKNPKTLYVSVRLFTEAKQGFVIGWCTKEDILSINRIENNGYLDNFVLYDNELRPISELIEIFKGKGFTGNE